MTKPRAEVTGGTALELRVERYEGDRSLLRPLLLLADDSEQEIASYLPEGVMFVARQVSGAGELGEIVGHLLLTDASGAGAEAAGALELKSMAVAERLQGKGGGRLLVEAAIAHCRARGARLLLVATAAAGIGQLRFYQRWAFACCASSATRSGRTTATPRDSCSRGSRCAIGCGSRWSCERELGTRARIEKRQQAQGAQASCDHAQLVWLDAPADILKRDYKVMKRLRLRA